MTSFSLTCVNNSELSGSFAVFQRPPASMTQGEILSLAWPAHPAAPQSRVAFTWAWDYNFVWSETGVLTPGLAFSASQVLPATPTVKT